MKQIYQDIIIAKHQGKKLLAVLLDPDKLKLEQLSLLCEKIKSAPITHIFVGGSIVPEGLTQLVVTELKKQLPHPIVLFPGDYSQITPQADALLFLSLISGDNPEFLITQHIQAIPHLEETNLEIIPTSYLLIDGGTPTAVQRVSKTTPLSQNDPKHIANITLAGQYLGHQLVYLEAGSGAKIPVSAEIIQQVRQKVTLPIIVGGGLTTSEQIQLAYTAGADMVVIGTAFEENPEFFKGLHL